MDSFEIVREHFDNGNERQQTPIKKMKEADFTSAETIEQTPDKNPIDDIDAQYLFEHFDEIVKVSFVEEAEDCERLVRGRLDYEEEGLLSPPAKFPNDLLSPTSMKKKRSNEKYQDLPEIELFPVNEPIPMRSLEIKEAVYCTLKKPIVTDQSYNILIRKQPYPEQSI